MVVSKAFSVSSQPPAIIPLLKHTKLGLVFNTMDVSLLLIVPVWQGKLFVFCVKNILDDPPLALHRLGLRGTTNGLGAKVTQLTTCTPKGMQIERIRRERYSCQM